MKMLAIEIIEGLNKGHKFKIEPGLISSSDSYPNIFNQSVKTAGYSARLSLDYGNNWVIQSDNDVTCFFVEGLPMYKMNLVEGLVFRIEDMVYRVEMANTIAMIQSPQFQMPKPNSNPAQKLSQLLLCCKKDLIYPFLPPGLRFFKNPISLKVTQGPQYESMVTAAWGPRKIGKSTFEFTLMEPTAPDISFVISATKNGEAVFFTDFPDNVFLNEKKRTDAVLLQDGDRINIKDTIIEFTEMKV